MDSVLEEKFKQIETWQFCLWRLVPSLELDYTGFNPVAMMLLLCFLASAKSWAPGYMNAARPGRSGKQQKQ